MKVRTRMAPSPTGLLHIGTAHTALYNYLLAKKNNGVFILRMDDTDMARNKEEFERDITTYLQWLGLAWDEGIEIGGPHEPYRQSARLAVYKKYTDELLEKGFAYRCFCTEEDLKAERQASQAKKDPSYRYSGRCRHLSPEQIQENLDTEMPFTIRMRTDFMDEVVVDDQIRGEIRVNGHEIGDFIIVRSDGMPVLLLTTTIDDIDMEITHAIRGEDMLNVSFRMAYIYKALDKSIPKYAHKPFLYAMDGKKLSKRHGATSVAEFAAQGYLPQAILNYLFFCGYTPTDDEKAFYTLKEMVEDFDFGHFQKGMPRFDYKKLQWYNSQYIRKLSREVLTEKLLPYLPENQHGRFDMDFLTGLVQERLTILSDFKELTDFLFIDSIAFPKDGWREGAAEQLEAVIEIVGEIENWTVADMTYTFSQLIEKYQWKTGDFYMNLRLAVAGKKITPPITECMWLLGAEAVVMRLRSTLSSLLR